MFLPDQRLNLVKKSPEEEETIRGQLICEFVMAEMNEVMARNDVLPLLVCPCPQGGFALIP